MSMLQFFILHFPSVSYWSLLVPVAAEVEVYPLIICTALMVPSILRIFSKCYGDTSRDLVNRKVFHMLIS